MIFPIPIHTGTPTGKILFTVKIFILFLCYLDCVWGCVAMRDTPHARLRHDRVWRNINSHIIIRWSLISLIMSESHSLHGQGERVTPRELHVSKLTTLKQEPGTFLQSCNFDVPRPLPRRPSSGWAIRLIPSRARIVHLLTTKSNERGGDVTVRISCVCYDNFRFFTTLQQPPRHHSAGWDHKLHFLCPSRRILSTL